MKHVDQINYHVIIFRIRKYTRTLFQIIIYGIFFFSMHLKLPH